MYHLNSVKQYYRFWLYCGFTVSRKFFEGRRLVIAVLLKTKPGTCKTKSMKRSKHPNRTVNLQALKTTKIVISQFFYTIYRALKLQYHPAQYVCTHVCMHVCRDYSTHFINYFEWSCRHTNIHLIYWLSSCWCYEILQCYSIDSKQIIF